MPSKGSSTGGMDSGLRQNDDGWMGVGRGSALTKQAVRGIDVSVWGWRRVIDLQGDWILACAGRTMVG